MKLRIALLLAGSLLLGGCGGDGAPKQAVAQTAAKLRDIHSGVLDVKLLVTPKGSSGATPYGFKLHGPFALGSNFYANVSYTQIANGKQATATLRAQNGKGTIVSNGKTRVLTSAQLGELRRAAAQATGSGGGSFLPVQNWVQSPKLSGCGANDCVTGRLDVVRATNDLLAFGRALGRDLPTIAGTDADRLKNSARSATFALVTGKDRLLRDLTIHIDLGLDVPQALQSALGSLVGAAFDLEFKIDRPNAVSAPS